MGNRNTYPAWLQVFTKGAQNLASALAPPESVSNHSATAHAPFSAQEPTASSPYPLRNYAQFNYPVVPTHPCSPPWWMNGCFPPPPCIWCWQHMTRPCQYNGNCPMPTGSLPQQQCSACNTSIASNGSRNTQPGTSSGTNCANEIPPADQTANSCPSDNQETLNATDSNVVNRQPSFRAAASMNNALKRAK